jgi:hypothetical protein
MIKSSFWICVVAVAILALPSSGDAGTFSRVRAGHGLHAHDRDRAFGRAPLLFAQAWNDGGFAQSWPFESWYGSAEYTPRAYPPLVTSLVNHWTNASAFREHAPYPTSQPDARIIENQVPVNADHDRMWVERCQPRIWFDEEGVERYYYNGKPGCAAGQWRDVSANVEPIKAAPH